MYCTVLYCTFLYLRSSPETALERMKERNRGEEAGVAIDYLRDLHT